MKQGILLMAYGSPETPDEIEPYYTDIRRGHKPPPNLLQELRGRYEAIGGKSPLLKITNHQAEETRKASRLPVFAGMRHWKPWIKDAMAEMKNNGIEQVAAIVMAPHYSAMSIEKYIEKVEEAKADLGYFPKIKYIKSWHNEPELIEMFAERVKAAIGEFSGTEKENITAIFTAHSLPEKILSANDPYQDQLLETARMVAERSGLKKWRFAFQSAGRTEEKWLGPDLREVIKEEADKGAKSILVCSVGFITDHLEVLYDIDVEAKHLANALGIHLVRAQSLNAEPQLGKLISKLAKKKLNEQ